MGIHIRKTEGREGGLHLHQNQDRQVQQKARIVHLQASHRAGKNENQGRKIQELRVLDRINKATAWLTTQPQRQTDMARTEYIHEWERMPRCYNLFGCPFKKGHSGTTEKRCILDGEKCSGKDKQAAREYAKSLEGQIIISEKERADEAAGLSCKVIQWRIEYAQHTLALAKELDLDETAGAIQQCMDTYARERDKRKEAGTWEQAK